MKTLLKLSLSCLILSSTAFGGDELTGDTRLACEAILCLSSSERPPECIPSLNRFFSITAKKPHETIRRRLNFLKLCPASEEAKNDQNLASLIDTLSNVRGGCDAASLNKNIEKKFRTYYSADSEHMKKIMIRINPKLPKYCENLAKHSYTNIKTLKYNCSDKFYNITDWNRGYELIAINEEKFHSLASDKVDKQPNPEYEKCNNTDHIKSMQNCYKNTPKYLYFEKRNIDKNCWIEQ